MPLRISKGSCIGSKIPLHIKDPTAYQACRRYSGMCSSSSSSSRLSLNQVGNRVISHLDRPDLHGHLAAQ
jgi:hypothetical protein